MQVVCDPDRSETFKIAETIRNDVSEGVDKQQREYLLRQQLAAIRKELGEGDDDVVAQYRERLENLEAAEKVKLAIDRELDRLERTSSQSPSTGGSAPGSTASSSCRGAPAPTTRSTSPSPARCSTTTTTACTT